MQSIHDLILKNRKFIGREKEIMAMNNLLFATDKDWHILHFYGPLGIGKTVLLKHFAKSHNELPIIYIDGHRGIQSSQQFLKACDGELNMLTNSATAELHGHDSITKIQALTKEHPIVILMLDGLDQCQSILDWLKNDFIPLLPTNIRIFSAGRFPLNDWQTDYGYEKLVKNIQLKPFRKDEWTAYACEYGITNPQLLYQIGYISQGIPLAVAIICSHILENEPMQKLTLTDRQRLLNLIDKYLFIGNHLDGLNSTLLILASITYTFDQELLEYMLGKSIADQDFIDLCQSSFVDAHPTEGWIINNGIRWWIRRGFKEKFPDTYATYIKRADTLLKQRLANTNPKNRLKILEITIGRFFLKDTVFTRSLVYFEGDRQLRLRSARKNDIPLLAKMYQKNLKVSPPFSIDDTHQEQYLLDIWNINPSYIKIIEQDDQPLFFYSFIPLNDEIMSVFQHNPVIAPLLNANSLGSSDWLFWILSANHPTDWEVVHYFFKHSFLPSLDNKCITCMLILKDQAELLRLFGFQHLSFADYQTISGMTFYFYQLDLRKEENDIEDWIMLTKEILSNYTMLEHKPLILERYKGLSVSVEDDDQLVVHIKEIINEVLKCLENGSKQENMQALILKYAYLKKVGSHEAVADFLQMATSTYYRHLKKLVSVLSEVLRTNAKKLD